MHLVPLQEAEGQRSHILALPVGADLATLVGYTEYYLTEKFKKETGQSVSSYIRYTKVERAKVLLESTELSIKEIADQLAFNTVNYFIQCFRDTVGYTPAQYRRRFKAG